MNTEGKRARLQDFCAEFFKNFSWYLLELPESLMFGVIVDGICSKCSGYNWRYIFQKKAKNISVEIGRRPHIGWPAGSPDISE